jgi:hypothetical protein
MSPDEAESYVRDWTQNKDKSDPEWSDTADQEEESVDDFLFEESLNEDAN